MDEPVFSRLRAVVDGRVQNVGFRYYVVEKANLLGLTGWVRNTTSGTVEVLAEGSRSALEDLLSYLRKGPRSAMVETVSQDWLPATGEFRNFTVKGTF